MTQNNVLPNQNLEARDDYKYEIGISGNFFDHEVNIDLAYYNKQTKDQIISATLAPETGYTETRNVGKLENQGIEAMLSVGTPIRNKDWEWGNWRNIY